jgi:cobalt-zinc-cadmium efflux system protein
VSNELIPAEATRARQTRRLSVVLGMVVLYALVEVVAAFSTGSLSLLSDAGHMWTDALGLAMSLAAIVSATSLLRNEQRTFGFYRLEILAALANAILLIGIAGYALYEGINRLGDPPEIEAGLMLWVAVGGLLVNMVAIWLLRRDAGASLNMEGAYTEVLADLLGSIGVIAAAVVYLSTGWPLADPLIAIAIGLWIIPRAIRLGWKAVSILAESAPSSVDVDAVLTDLAGVDGVTGVHDLHVWTLTSNMDLATAHLVVSDAADLHSVLDTASHLLKTAWGIDHATIQVEPESHADCVEQSW